MSEINTVLLKCLGNKQFLQKPFITANATVNLHTDDFDRAAGL